MKEEIEGDDFEENRPEFEGSILIRRGSGFVDIRYYRTSLMRGHEDPITHWAYLPEGPPPPKTIVHAVGKWFNVDEYEPEDGTLCVGMCSENGYRFVLRYSEGRRWGKDVTHFYPLPELEG